MEAHDFVELCKIAPNVSIDTRYATINNFTGQAVYSSPRCFLRRAVAEKLAEIQNFLESRELRLKVWDGYRPFSVQKKFWELVPDERYVANPNTTGSNHNRGAAVDVTLTDEKGIELLMPTLFDDFTVKAHRDCFDLPQEAIDNRFFLEEVMVMHGFIPYPTEWWHFDDSECKKYPLEDIPIENLRHT